MNIYGQPAARKPLKISHTKKKGGAPASKETGFDRHSAFAGINKSSPKKGKENRKKISIEQSSCTQGKLAAGCHKQKALQKHQGIVKPKMRKRLETIEHFIKRRNLGEVK